MSRKFYKTTFYLHVLSEDYSVEHLPLEKVVEAITTGDCVGRFEAIHRVGLTRKKVVKQLLKLGSEPVFFGLDDNGKDLP